MNKLSYEGGESFHLSDYENGIVLKANADCNALTHIHVCGWVVGLDRNRDK